jgi:putative glycosyltransferase
MKLSVVATLYRSAPYVDEFCDRAIAAARAAGAQYEIVLVNDGSPDDSLARALACAGRCEHVKVVDLSRNFGHHRAMMEGLRHASGDHVFLIDSDLEEEPEWLAPFLARLREQGADVAYGVQERRRGGWFDRLAGRAYYGLFRAVSGLPIPHDHTTARLMTRRYVDALTAFREHEVDLTGLFVIAGFEQVPCAVTKHATSRSTYTFARKVGFAIDSLVSFSSFPLVAIFYFGLLVSAGAAAFTAYLVVNRLFLSTPVDGWTSVMASIWLLGGLLIAFVGVVGLYLAKVFTEVKQRPAAIVRAVHGRGLDAAGDARDAG